MIFHYFKGMKRTASAAPQVPRARRLPDRHRPNQRTSLPGGCPVAQGMDHNRAAQEPSQRQNLPGHQSVVAHLRRVFLPLLAHLPPGPRRAGDTSAKGRKAASRFSGNSTSARQAAPSRTATRTRPAFCRSSANTRFSTWSNAKGSTRRAWRPRPMSTSRLPRLRPFGTPGRTSPP